MRQGKAKRWYRPILLQYGMRALKVTACGSFYKKVAAYHVTTDKGEFLLKPFAGFKSRLDRVYSRIVWLTGSGFSNMPKWRTTLRGKHYVNKNGRLYYVSDWIKGSKLGDRDEDYEKIGEVLAQLHKVSKRSASGFRRYSAKEINRFRQQHRLFISNLAVIKKTGSSKWLTKHGNQCVSLAEKAWKTLRHPDIQQALKNEKPCIIHGDVTTPNIILNSNGVVLVDWEFARLGSAYYEIAKTMSNISNYSLPYMRVFLSGYEKISPLKPEERLIIASLFRLPREAWIAAGEIRSGRPSPAYTILKKAWTGRIRAVEWVDHWAKTH
ncbi:hypothetical protein SD71_03995 [Cohnella kolymensis]|uniref:Aminoglycoside phosphotransferase domain-containing protein n=1 Tax=Cohnella kolymensis TaxID=1590652 RepID=A0ABR5A7S6_9BACL|nr:phosphotransferase [Cohnella kolymensis]KIL37126.1 hypothetical protein SD71_03995 [Cohnella kolymensis]